MIRITLIIRRLATKDYWFPRADRNGLAIHFYKMALILKWQRS